MRSFTCGSFRGKKHFHALVQVPRHPVRAPQVDFRLPAIFKIKDAAVFQETANDAAYPDAAAEPAKARHEGALAANDEIDFNASLRSAVQGSNHRGIDNCVALRNDACGTPAAGGARFAFQQRFVMSLE
jgi:hypothetical protein